MYGEDAATADAATAADALTMVTAIMTTMIITMTTTMTMMMIVVCCDYFGSLVHRTDRLQFCVKRILSI